MNYKLILIISFILLNINLIAQNESETRNFIKTVPVGNETTLEVINKYGRIQITPWSKDSASIRAEVKAVGNDKSKLSKMFDGIRVNITDSKYIVRAETEFTSNLNTFFESFKGMTSKLIPYDSHIEINYYISIPEYLNLKIDNKYGDVYMESCTGELNVSVSNGSFKASSLGKNSTVKMSFCDANINSAGATTIDASFSDITIGSVEDLTITSISSKYNIKKAGIIRGESRRDKFFIDDVRSMHGNAYFTDYKIKNISKELNLESRYGSINADLIEKGFGSVDINSGYSDVSLTFDPASSYSFDLRSVNTFVVLPDNNIKSEKKLSMKTGRNS